MKMSYFQDTDTLYIEFKNSEVIESKDLDNNTLLDLDANGDIVAITLEHAATRTDVHQLTLTGIAA